jgi:glycosyltransferase involved in cell wall biosynthesis
MLGLPVHSPLVGFVGRSHLFHEEKGLPELIEAFSFVSDPAAILLCVGGPLERVPAYLAHARRMSVDPKRLRFVDRVPNAEVPLWLKALDLGVIPYPNAPHFALAASPLKLFEYMAAGTPIVATDLASTRLVLTHEQNALLVEAGNARALGSAIARLLSDVPLADRLAASARESVAGQTWTARAQRILQAAGVTS